MAKNVLMTRPTPRRDGSISPWPSASGILLALLERGATVILANHCWFRYESQMNGILSGVNAESAVLFEGELDIDLLRETLKGLRALYEGKTHDAGI